MKKIWLAILVVIGCFTLSGCTEKELTLGEMPREEMLNELKLIENNLVYVWNDCLAMISWYSMEGTDQNGEEIDINNVVSKLKLYFADFGEYNSKIQTLPDSNKNLKEVWNNTYQELNVIYKAVLNKTPVANENIEYKANIDAYESYMIEYRNLLKELEQEKVTEDSIN